MKVFFNWIYQFTPIVKYVQRAALLSVLYLVLELANVGRSSWSDRGVQAGHVVAFYLIVAVIGAVTIGLIRHELKSCLTAAVVGAIAAAACEFLFMSLVYPDHFWLPGALLASAGAALIGTVVGVITWQRRAGV